ncbi:MAG: nitroreductase [Flavitalea sp.]
MEHTQVNTIEEVIRQRRTIKPDKMNGGIIADEEVQEILELADWAPTHARTEPWRFVVYNQDQVFPFCQIHAGLYKDTTAEASFLQAKYDNLLHMGDKVSHIVIAYMVRVPTHKIPEIEEVTAAACAIQNVLLGATSKGISTFWSTGGLAHHPALREYLKMGEEDRVMGILYLGYTDEPLRPGSRMIPLSEKIQWVK